MRYIPLKPILASNEMTVKQFCNEIKKDFKKYLPKFNLKVETANESKFNVQINIAVKDIDDYSKIEPLHVRFLVESEKLKCADLNQCQLPEKMALTVEYNKFLTVPDSEKEYYELSTHKFSFRKVSGDSKKILTVLDKYFKTMKNDIEELLNNGKIHHFHSDLLKDRI